ncbi:hypothetical protein NUU61_002725 [Penicillium alfredii]|uniref:Uncharacterized protein n=1 Tax=Penicillium alfredii TaxID=1506179 RepID=A0A9W9FS89_9EURO|nr:uncharacterized protein NUU61_002725 [Penicillium alfredii]KAJ5105378.1 hypothetical protein NUU61_002725 [Penicillium alfredii]
MTWVSVALCSALLLQALPSSAASFISSNRRLPGPSSVQSIPPPGYSASRTTQPVVPVAAGSSTTSKAPGQNRSTGTKSPSAIPVANSQRLVNSEYLSRGFSSSSESPANPPITDNASSSSSPGRSSAGGANSPSADNTSSALSSGSSSGYSSNRPATGNASNSSWGNSAAPTGSPGSLTPASESVASTTVTATSVSIDTLSTPTDSSAKGVVSNPQDSSESVTFVKQDIPSDLKGHLPSVPEGSLLPMTLNIGGVQTPVVVDSTGGMVIPLGDVPAWLTPDLFPAPDKISKMDDGKDDDEKGDDDPSSSHSSSPSSALLSSKSSASSSWSSSPPLSQSPSQTSASSSFSSQSRSRSAKTSISITITYDVGTLTANTVGGLTTNPPLSGSLPVSAKLSKSSTRVKDTPTTSPLPTPSSSFSASSMSSAASSASSSSFASSPTLNCQQNIPTDGPLPSDVVNALNAKNTLRYACNGTFNSGSGDSTHQVFSHGDLAVTVIRSSSAVALTHCKKAFQAIQDTCINQNRNYGGTYTQGDQTYIIENGKYPENPLILGEDNGATTPTPKAPPMPHETDGNNKGSSLCKNLSGACKRAYRQYVDDFLYKGETSYVASAGDADPVNWLPFANNGCTAMFRVENMYQTDHVEECGSTYLDNGCHITLNGCQDCRSRIPCDVIPEGGTRYGCYH